MVILVNNTIINKQFPLDCGANMQKISGGDELWKLDRLSNAS